MGSWRIAEVWSTPQRRGYPDPASIDTSATLPACGVDPMCGTTGRVDVTLLERPRVAIHNQPRMEDRMTRTRVAGFGVSLDGYAAGTEQSLEDPLGKRGSELFEWYFPTRSFREMQGESGGETGPDDEFARRAMDGFGAFILGRNMFGPIRGEWPDDGWRGWWGDDPPYHAPTFVLTHHPRASIEMDGGTTFHFITDGIEAALGRAWEAAGQKDIKIGGGVETVRQYIGAGHVDEIHLAVAPVVLGQGEALFDGIDLRALGYRTTEHVPTERATHVVLVR
jgi:dihydrofolate reductase